MTENSVLLLKLLKAAFCGDDALRSLGSDTASWQNVDWDSLLGQISENGMEAIAFDGLQRLHGCDGFHTGLDLAENEDIRYEWMGLHLTTEQDFEHYRKVIAALTRYLASRGAGRVLVLKGYGLALNYPDSRHRTVGDIDIYSLDGKSAEIDRLLSRFKGFEKSSCHARHSHAIFHGISIENHYCFSDAINNPRRDKALEQVLVEEALNHSRKIDIDGVEFYVPSAEFNAIFLVWHMACHFTLEKISMRMLTDYLCFLKKEGRNIDWEKVSKVLSAGHKQRAANLINAFLIDYLGLDSSLVPPFTREAEDELRMAETIMSPGELATKGPEAVIKYIRRRWNFRISHDEHWLVPLFRSILHHLRH